MLCSVCVPLCQAGSSTTSCTKPLCDAMKLMNMEVPEGDDQWSRTPVVKRPMASDSVERDLKMTPPPVVNQQSET